MRAPRAIRNSLASEPKPFAGLGLAVVLQLIPGDELRKVDPPISARDLATKRHEDHQTRAENNLLRQNT
jgi:hypothetical protein